MVRAGCARVGQRACRRGARVVLCPAFPPAAYACERTCAIFMCSTRRQADGQSKCHALSGTQNSPSKHTDRRRADADSLQLGEFGLHCPRGHRTSHASDPRLLPAPSFVICCAHQRSRGGKMEKGKRADKRAVKPLGIPPAPSPHVRCRTCRSSALISNASVVSICVCGVMACIELVRASGR